MLHVLGVKDVLKRLLDTERAARDRVAGARERADERVAKATREAEERVEKARAEAQSEADSIVRAAEEEADRGHRAQLQRAGLELSDADALRERGAGRIEEAAAFLSAWVAGEEL